MEFGRQWDATCPKVWDSWEKDGAQWWVQDLPPEDDELAVEILEEHFAPDEPTFMTGRVLEDPLSLEFVRGIWLESIKKRMTLACYTYINGEKILTGFTVLIVKCLGEDEHRADVEGKKFKTLHHLIDSLSYSEAEVDVFKYYGIDKILYCAAFVVRREFRGKKLGTKLLDAWEPLCKHLGVEASSAVFSAPASQKLAARCGFETLAVVSFKQLAKFGLNYPMDETKVMKFMSKRYE